MYIVDIRVLILLLFLMYHVSQRIVLFAVLYLRIFFDSVKETTGICIIFVSFYNILIKIIIINKLILIHKHVIFISAVSNVCVCTL